MAWLISKALLDSFENSRSSPGVAVESSVENCSDGGQSVPLKSTNMRQVFLYKGKMKDFSRLSRFGMMLKPLTEDHGEVLLTWFLADSRARISVSPGLDMESKVSDQDFGENLLGWFAKYDQNLSLWRTRQLSFLEGLTEYSGIWPRWGTMRNGVCLARMKLALRTEEKESGYWPTLTVNDAKNSTFPESQKNRDSIIGMILRENSELGGQLNPDWAEWLMGFPIGWTGLNVLEMRRCRWPWPRHGESCLKG